MKTQLVSELDRPANPETMDRDTRLKQVLRLAAIRDSVAGWNNAVEQLGPVTVDLVNELSLPMVCAAYGSLDVLGVLKGMGADLARPGQDGKSPLHEAAENGDVEIAAFLLDAGVPVDLRIIDPQDVLGMNGCTPLHMAAAEGEGDVCSLLLARGADVNAVCGEGLTPLGRAMTGVTADGVVEALLRAGADESDIMRAWKKHYPDTTLANPFQVVLKKGLVSTGSYYLNERGADLGQLTKRGKTMTQLAQSSEKPEEIRSLIMSHRCCTDTIARLTCGGSSGASIGM